MSVLILAGLFILANPSSVGQASTALVSAHAFPVPFMPSRGDTAITFTDLALDSTIKIYLPDGSLVHTIHSTDGSGLYAWDAKSSSGDDLSSGVYFYVITAAADEKKGRLVIVR